MDKGIIRKYASKRDLVVDALREMIFSGQLAPGQRLKQEELTRALGVSATPVREAIRLLEAEGLLRGEPHCGVSIVELTPDELEDLWHIRSTLEGLATRQAVDRSDPQAYVFTVQHLDLLQREMETCIESGAVAPVPKMNREFHLLLYDQSRSPYLIDMIRRLWMHLPEYTVWRIPELASAGVGQHRSILEALKARQGGAAARAMQVHIELTSIALLARLREREAAGTAPALARGVPATSRG